MAKKTQAQAADIAEAIYDRTRRIALRATADVVKALDELYAEDAEKMKRELRRVFARGGLPLARANKIVDDVMKASRKKRVGLVADAVREAAKAGVGADEKTFKAVFEGDREAAVPFGRAPSASPRRPTPWLRLVSASEARSPSID